MAGTFGSHLSMALRGLSQKRYPTASWLDRIYDAQRGMPIACVASPWEKLGRYKPPSFVWPSMRKFSAPSRPERIADVEDSLRMLSLLNAFRTRGHLVANLDPLGRGLGPLVKGLEKMSTVPEDGQDLYEFLRGYPDKLYMHGRKVSPQQYLGLRNQDPNHQVYLGPESWAFNIKASNQTKVTPLVDGKLYWTLDELVSALSKVYCNTAGWEISHIISKEETLWLAHQIETKPFETPAPSQRALLDRLLKAETLEKFLGVAFPAHKRFGLEGCEALVPGMHALFQRAVELGVAHVELGMAHRGRLNILSNILQKDKATLLSEMDGKHSEYHVGDVKYHQGLSSVLPFAPDDVKDVMPGKCYQLEVGLTPNPSHLEAVNAVVVGRVHARQKQLGERKEGEGKVLGLLIHGDAAFSGLGIGLEVMNLGSVPGYNNGGTIHVIINNQIGFTTDPKKARSTPFPSDLAKGASAPIFHVNADDPEAVVRAFVLAVEYWHRFHKDVVVDVVGYRRNGHNEQDDPTLTQPVTYEIIKKHPTCAEQYAARLRLDNVVDQSECDTWRAEKLKTWEEALALKSDFKECGATWLRSTWQGAALGGDNEKREKGPIEYTGLDISTLQFLGERLSTLPEGFVAHPHITKLMAARANMFKGPDSRVDWAMAEQLAFGAMLCHHLTPDHIPNTPSASTVPHHHVRLSGQDSSRGTFNQRHSVLYNQTNSKQYMPLNNIMPGYQDRMLALDSPLSEAGVLGFEYGYSLDSDDTIVMWEAQFGDFANNAQVVIDEFVASAEEKWGQTSRIILLLPHGYDGQGPDHSSARLERFLQLCNDDPDGLPGSTPKHRQLIAAGYRALTQTASAAGEAGEGISRDQMMDYMHSHLTSTSTNEQANIEAVMNQADGVLRNMQTGGGTISFKEWEKFMVQYIRRHFEHDANMFVVNVTSPAQYFHVLRMQMKRPYRKPLVVLSPKWLLHHRPCTSALKDFDKSSYFTRVIDDGKFSDNTRHRSHHPQTKEPYLLKGQFIRRVVLCSGQVYYKLSQVRRGAKVRDIVLVRLEMIAPFPHDLLTSVIANYENADIVWCQEEPKNMGAWLYVKPRIDMAVRLMCESGGREAREVVYIGRAASAAKTTASPDIHQAETIDLCRQALALTDQ